MKSMIRKLTAGAAVVALMVTTVVSVSAADKEMTDTDKVSVIFTHDMHSHMDEDKAEVDGRVVSQGGFARLKTVKDNIMAEYENSIFLDAGDFSMGTPYQTIFSSEASELKMMGYLGYDATTFGNHEFDYRAEGLAGMLEAAWGEGPVLVSSNIDWKETLEDSELKENAGTLKKACDDYGVSEYAVIEKDGLRAAVFGLMGESAVDYAPESGLLFNDAIESAEKTVEKIRKNEKDIDMIICLSHCGTVENEKDEVSETEDYKLAEAVPDIDIIISGHSHTALDEPLQIGDTFVVSCGSYNASAGHIVLNKTKEGYKLDSYELIPLESGISKDEGVEKELDKYRELVNTEYFNDYGYNTDTVLATNDISFTPIEEMGLVQGEDTLGDIIADSYKYAVAEAGDEADVTIVPCGVIRGTFLKGDITAADAFNVSSLGYGKDGLAGYPLVKAYLTGKELKAAAEVDASISDFMGVARLYCSGLEYSWNPNRLILNRAVDVRINDGETIEAVENDRLYSVVADLYSCQMLGSVKDKSMGLIKIEPKDKNGKPIDNFEDHIIYDGDREVKAWYALASYIDSFDGDKVPEYYAVTHGRKTEIDSKSPVELFKQPNMIMAIAAAVIAVLVIAIIGIVLLIRRRRCR